MKKLIIAGLLSSLLAGCAGIGGFTITGKQDVVVAAKHGESAYICPGKEIGQYKECEVMPTQKDFREAWGEPSSVTKNDSKETWTYNRDVAIRGVVALVVIIPVPLVAPAGFNKETLEFESGTIVSRASERGTGGSSAMAECSPSEADWSYHCRAHAESSH